MGAKQEWKIVRIRSETYSELVALRDVIVRRGVEQLPEGIRMRVVSLGDAIDLALRAAQKAIGKRG